MQLRPTHHHGTESIRCGDFKSLRCMIDYDVFPLNVETLFNFLYENKASESYPWDCFPRGGERKNLKGRWRHWRRSWRKRCCSLWGSGGWPPSRRRRRRGAASAMNVSRWNHDDPPSSLGRQRRERAERECQEVEDGSRGTTYISRLKLQNLVRRSWSRFGFG